MPWANANSISNLDRIVSVNHSRITHYARKFNGLIAVSLRLAIASTPGSTTKQQFHRDEPLLTSICTWIRHDCDYVACTRRCINVVHAKNDDIPNN